ncbi:MAG: hypothetical protein GF410_15545 [Chitinivibrionales bacterium]|nr:hypothetical protein [Chitinivibrionales bacterium]
MLVLATLLARAALCDGTAGRRPGDYQFIRGHDIAAGLYARSVWVGETHTALAALPLYYSGALTEQLAADAAVAPAFGYAGSRESIIARASDLRLRLSYNLKNAVLFTLGGRIPAGPNRFSQQQTITQGNLSARQLDFDHSYLYASPDVCAGAASSLSFSDIGPGDLSLGLALSYLFKGPFHPVDDIDAKFDPGDEINVALAAEYAALLPDRRATFTIDAGYTYFGKDRFEGVDTTHAGGKFNWALSAATTLTDAVPVLLSAANFVKGAQRDRYGTTGKNTSDLYVSLRAGLPVFKALAPYGQAGLQVYTGGGPAEAMKAVVGCLELGIARRLGERLFGTAAAAFDAGTMGNEARIGTALTGGLEYRF